MFGYLDLLELISIAVATFLIWKASHLDCFQSVRYSSHLLVTPAQLMRPDIVVICRYSVSGFALLPITCSTDEKRECLVFNYPSCACCQGKKDGLIVSVYAEFRTR